MTALASVDPAEVAAALRARISVPPEVHLVLGSGLSGLAHALEAPVEVAFSELPGLPSAGVAGHAGRFVAGRLAGRSVLVQAGRYHLYEGHPPEVVCAPSRAAHALGARTLILTNAAGGIDPRMEPGTLMLLDDHLLLGSPRVLTGPEHAALDMTAPYDPALARLAMSAAAELGIPLARGVYASVPGPSYETPAEVRALARFGAHAVGMSTVPEVLAARALGTACLAVSVITNHAAGVGRGTLSHDDVIAVGRAAGARLEALLRRVLERLPA